MPEPALEASTTPCRIVEEHTMVLHRHAAADTSRRTGFEARGPTSGGAPGAPGAPGRTRPGYTTDHHGCRDCFIVLSHQCHSGNMPRVSSPKTQLPRLGPAMPRVLWPRLAADDGRR